MCEYSIFSSILRISPRPYLYFFCLVRYASFFCTDLFCSLSSLSLSSSSLLLLLLLLLFLQLFSIQFLIYFFCSSFLFFCSYLVYASFAITGYSIIIFIARILNWIHLARRLHRVYNMFLFCLPRAEFITDFLLYFLFQTND